MASRILRSTDIGAPILVSNIQGSIISLLRAALVDGYGSTAPLGYSLEYIDTNGYKAVFRQGGGTRTFVQFDNTDAANIHKTFVRGFPGMSNIDTGLLACPAIGTNSFLVSRTPEIAAHSTPVPWVIIGDNKGFWLLMRSRLSNRAADHIESMMFPFYIGDYVPYNADNVWNFSTCLWDNAGDALPYNLRYSATITAANTRTWIARGYNKAPYAKQASFAKGSFFEGSCPGHSGLSGEVSGRILFSIPLLFDPVTTAPMLMGIFPGLKAPLVNRGPNYDSTSNYFPDVEITQENGDTLHIFRYWQSAGGVNYIYGLRMGLIVGEGFRDGI